MLAPSNVVQLPLNTRPVQHYTEPAEIIVLYLGSPLECEVLRFYKQQQLERTR